MDSESDAESSEKSDNDVAGGPSLAKSKWRVTDLKSLLSCYYRCTFLLKEL